MERADLERKILDVVREQKTIPDAPPAQDTPLVELGIDSLDALNILFALEEAFDITIPDERARSIRTLGDLVSVIEIEVASR
ncbi:MAG: acyl carrier protein [Thermoanaerobaculia bacterium]